MPRLLAIGDIHGHAAALEHLIRVARIGAGDTVVTLGDHVDRGPDSEGVIERLRKLGETAQLIPLLGNHEVMMLQARESAEALEFWLQCGGDAVLNSYRIISVDDVPKAHWAFLQDCRRYHEAEKVFFVHANVDPSLPLEDQPDGELFWKSLYQAPWHVSGKTMICGHTPQISGRPLHLGRAICIDTHVHVTGWLTCLDSRTGFYWQACDNGMTRTGILDPQDGDFSQSTIHPCVMDR